MLMSRCERAGSCCIFRGNLQPCAGPRPDLERSKRSWPPAPNPSPQPRYMEAIDSNKPSLSSVCTCKLSSSGICIFNRCLLHYAAPPFPLGCPLRQLTDSSVSQGGQLSPPHQEASSFLDSDFR
ncbi:hypothetical protein BaRGS_00002044 [Batillaria attramentaria]|uniref:Uncharacterized protein n=1 Tax=Batillaria attramentaria TaxID=370345 RepID=A0ABD0M3T2_9CAEN